MRQQLRQDYLVRQGTAPTVGQTGVRVTIDRTYPLDAIKLIVAVTTGGTAPTVLTADGIGAIVKRINVTVNDGSSRTVVDASGPALLEYWYNTTGMFDRNTAKALLLGIPASGLADGQGGKLAASTTYYLSYMIPFAHPQLMDPLRMFTQLPAHMMQTDPVLTIDFGATADCWGTGTAPTLDYEVVLLRRDMPAALHQKIIAAGGFIQSDLLEYAVPNIPTSSSDLEVRFDLPAPGQYTGLLFREYQSAVLRGFISGGGTDNPITGAQWRIDEAGFVHRRFRKSHIEMMNDWTRPGGFWSAAQSAVPSPAPMFAFSGCAYLDFLTDFREGDPDELGSLLNTNNALSRGVKVSAIGTVYGGTGRALKVLGHRFTTDNVNTFKKLT